MALSPEDIVNHEFKQSLRGYAITEVDDLLDRLADQIERADRDLEDLRQRLRDADARVTEALATESSLKRTLITAQDAAQRTIDDARAHADQVRGDAEREATERLEDARDRAASMLQEAESEAVLVRASHRAEQEEAAARIVELAAIEDRYRSQLRHLLESQLAALEAVDADGPAGGPEVAELRAAAAAAAGHADGADHAGDDEVADGTPDTDGSWDGGGMLSTDGTIEDLAGAWDDEADRGAPA